MIRDTLIVASVLVCLGLAWIGAEWAWLNYVPAPTPIEVPVDAFVQHAGYEAMADRAIEAFAAMPASRRRDLVENLRSNIGNLDAELARLDASRLVILCVGERHMASTRRFLADTMFPRLAIDALLLEIPGDELPEMLRQIDADVPEVPLLGEDIAAIVRSVRSSNAAIVIAGIDESASQKAQRYHLKRGSRDISIAANLRSHIRRTKRQAVLFGALHCADQPNWMYRRVQSSERRVNREEIRNVNIIGEHQDGTLEAFLVFAHTVGVDRREFMIADTAALDRLIFAWFPALTNSFLRFDAVIVFREHDHTHIRNRR